MIRLIYRLFIVLVVVALCLGLVLLNREPLTVFLGAENSFTANTGVILLVTFLLGILATTTVAGFFGVKAFFRERALKARDRQRQSFLDGMLLARSLRARGDHDAALTEWQRLMHHDPTEVLAALELSQSLESQGDRAGALKVLDEARSRAPKNSELLLRAAALHASIGNRTAAIDNLALVMAQNPSEYAAAWACSLSEELGRIADAREYLRELERLAPLRRDTRSTSARLDYKELVERYKVSPEELRTELRAFLRRNPECVPAARDLAEREAAAGLQDDAAQLYVKAAKLTGSSEDWGKAIQIWIKAGEPQKAIAAARSAHREISDTLPAERCRGELNLLRVFLAVNMLEEAEATLASVERTLSEGHLSSKLVDEAIVLRGILYFQRGDTRQAAELWSRLDSTIVGRAHAAALANRASPDSESAPAPRLSTP